MTPRSLLTQHPWCGLPEAVGSAPAPTGQERRLQRWSGGQAVSEKALGAEPCGRSWAQSRCPRWEAQSPARSRLPRKRYRNVLWPRQNACHGREGLQEVCRETKFKSSFRAQNFGTPFPAARKRGALFGESSHSQPPPPARPSCSPGSRGAPCLGGHAQSTARPGVHSSPGNFCPLGLSKEPRRKLGRVLCLWGDWDPGP